MKNSPEIVTWEDFDADESIDQAFRKHPLYPIIRRIQEAHSALQESDPNQDAYRRLRWEYEAAVAEFRRKAYDRTNQHVRRLTTAVRYLDGLRKADFAFLAEAFQ
ncbi:hypothetical protein DRH27_05595, partial [Candidatus Falkowbacteria bacterium]